MQAELSLEYKNMANTKAAELSEHTIVRPDEKDYEEEVKETKKVKIEEGNHEEKAILGQEEDSSESSSWSSEQYTMQRPDIPLKC